LITFVVPQLIEAGEVVSDWYPDGKLKATETDPEN